MYVCYPVSADEGIGSPPDFGGPWPAGRLFYACEEETMHSDAAIERFYSTKAWRKCRASFLSERGGLCEICLSRGLIEPAVHVHHKVKLTPDNIDDPAVTLSFDNLMALCEACHQEQHRARRWRCDAAGRVSL